MTPVMQSCADMSSVFAEGGNLQIGSDGSQTFQGYIDEVPPYLYFSFQLLHNHKALATRRSSSMTMRSPRRRSPSSTVLPRPTTSLRS
jgi:hypothetical protein